MHRISIAMSGGPNPAEIIDLVVLDERLGYASAWVAEGMAATAAPLMPPADYIANCKWLTEAEVDVYATEYGRTGFTGALQGYRVRRGSDPRSIAEMHTFSGRTIDVPSQYIAGKSDWGVYQTPGAVDKMRNSACTNMVGFHLLDGAGHWVQQEQPQQVSALLIGFLRDYAKR
jgi:pimeloyl-ACP methyl ester carboxylesterase